MDIVSFETAQKLKRAGLPQPNIHKGMLLYDKDGRLMLVAEPIHNHLARLSLCLLINDAALIATHINLGDSFFCPSAEYILAAKAGLYLSPMGHGEWGVFRVGTREMIGFHRESAAEACAEAFIHLFDPKKTVQCNL